MHWQGCSSTEQAYHPCLGESQADNSNQGGVYKACAITTLLYGSETWPTYANQEQKLNSFGLRCLRSILSIGWSNKVPNTQVTARADLLIAYIVLREGRLRWLGLLCRIVDASSYLKGHILWQASFPQET